MIKPKPKLTKAERREKQERERAAKASARIGGQGQQQGAGPGSLPGGKQANASSPPGRPGPEAGQVVTKFRNSSHITGHIVSSLAHTSEAVGG